MTDDTLKQGPSPAATAFALGAAWARRYGQQGARELADALLRGVSSTEGGS